MNTYFQSTRPGYVRLYHTPFDSFWCCTGSGIENHARYAETIYAEKDGALYVNLFLASTLDWRQRGIRVTQTTQFPDVPTTTLRFESDRRQSLTLRIRQPAWCAVLAVDRNGKRAKAYRRPGEYLEMKVSTGDRLDLQFAMALHAKPLPNAPDHVALMYGPLVLAGRLGTQGLTPGSQLIVNERESGKMLQANVKIPRWNRPLAELLANTTRPDTRKLEFRTTGFADGDVVDLAPWFRLTHERYNLYWRLYPPA
jgi:DUF1680 family protein